MFISSKQSPNTVGKCQITELRGLSLMHEFIFLLIKTCLLFHWFYIFKTKEDPQKELKLRAVFILKLLNDTLAFCSLKNLNFLLPHTAHFHKIISFPLFVFAAFEFLLSVFFYTSNNILTLFYKKTKLFHVVLIFVDFLFPFSYHHILLM